MAIAGLKVGPESFWELAAFVDVHGAHKLQEANVSAKDVRRLYAFWAWSQNNRVTAPRDGVVEEITMKVAEAFKVVSRIMMDDEKFLAEGDKYRAGEEDLNKSSFVKMVGKVIVRKSGKFTNHLYLTPDGLFAPVVVAMNTTTGAINISFADPIPGLSCKDLVQYFWGDKAGGRDTIAGSPRGETMTDADLENAAYLVSKRLS